MLPPFGGVGASYFTGNRNNSLYLEFFFFFGQTFVNIGLVFA